MDKTTYKKYRATPSLRQAAKALIQINPAARDNFQFATVKVTSDHRCPFLTTENLCSIHVRHGEGLLSKACRQYPRVLTRFGGKTQKALFLSCPEATRLVLLSSQLLPAPERPLYRCVSSLEEEDCTEAALHLTMRHLRTMALDLLQDRSYPLWQRLFLLGIICRRVRESPPGQARWKVPQLLSQYATIISEGRLRPHLDGIPSRPEPQLGLVSQLIQRRFQLGQPEDGFASRVAHFLQVVGMGGGAPQPDSAKRYSQAYLSHVLPFEQTVPLFLENYLFNHVFRTGFPSTSGVDRGGRLRDPLVSYLFMALHYRLLHSLLIGEATWHGSGFSAAHAIPVVYTFARAVEHNVNFFDEMLRLAQSPQLQTSDGMAMILRS